MCRGLALLFFVALAACAAPQTGTAPRNPLDPAAPSASLASPDRSCKVDADCAVKNIGNCCGYYPACVNRSALVDPAAVQAQCRASNQASVCGFREVSSCSCVQGKCENAGGATQSLLPATQ